MTVSTATLGTLALTAAGVVAVAGLAGYAWSQAPEWNALQATQLGGRDPSLHPDAIVGSRRGEPSATQQYLLVKVGNIYSVRGVDDLKRGIPYSSFRHGGNSSDNATYTKVAGPFALHQAHKALVSKIKANSMRKPPLAEGLVGDIDGTSTTIDDWGALDAYAVMADVNK